MTKTEIIEYEIWRKTLPVGLRNSLDPSNIADLFMEQNIFPTDKQPEWLTDMQKEIALGFFKDRKVTGVKFLYDIAKEHVRNPIKWSLDFLNNAHKEKTK